MDVVLNLYLFVNCISMAVTQLATTPRDCVPIVVYLEVCTLELWTIHETLSVDSSSFNERLSGDGRDRGRGCVRAGVFFLHLLSGVWEVFSMHDCEYSFGEAEEYWGVV
jgi:hypothetical protein